MGEGRREGWEAKRGGEEKREIRNRGKKRRGGKEEANQIGGEEGGRQGRK